MAEKDSEPLRCHLALSMPVDGVEQYLDNSDDKLTTYSPAYPKNHSSKSHVAGSRESEFARVLLAERRLRGEILGTDLFGEPVWEMLLDLLVTHDERQKNVSVSSLCIASTAPATTALRWIHALVARGYVVRRQDPRDGRRVWIELSPHIAAQMRGLLRLWISERNQFGAQAPRLPC